MKELKNLSHKLLAEGQVADFLGCETKTLQNWRVTGKGPAFVKVGRLVRYRPEAVEEFLVANTQQSCEK